MPTADSVVLMLDDDTVQSQRLDRLPRCPEDGACLGGSNHADNWVSASALVDIVAPKTTFYRNVRELEREHIVELDTTGRWPRYRIPQPPENGPVGQRPAVVPQSHP